MTIDLEAARRWLEAAKILAARARSLADIDGRSELAGVLDRAFLEAPTARGIDDPGALREIAARDPALAAELGRVLDWPAVNEAELRAEIALARVVLAKQTVGFSEWLERFHSTDPAVRGEAADAGLPILRPFVDRLLQLGRRLVPKKAPPPPIASRLASTAGGILLPTAGLIEQINLGIFDPAALTPAPPPPAKVGSSSAGELGELAQALIESLLRAPPDDFWSVLTARASADRADFRPRPIGILSALGGVRALPFGQPGVPWARRPGAAVFSPRDAYRSIAHLFGAGALAGPWSLGGALAFTATTAAFVRGGLSGFAPDPLAARRALALSVALAGLEHQLAREAEGDPEALMKAYATHLGVSPARSLAIAFAAEEGLTNAPGEDRALYAHAGAAMLSAFELGAPAAERLRDRFDEDWWRNPNASREAVLDALVGLEPAPGRATEWLKMSAGL